MVDARQSPQTKGQRSIAHVITQDSRYRSRNWINATGQQLTVSASVRWAFSIGVAGQLSGQVERETSCRCGGSHRIRLHHDRQVPIESAKRKIRRLHFHRFRQLRRVVVMAVKMKRAMMTTVVVGNVILLLDQRRQVARASAEVMVVMLLVLMVRRQRRSGTLMTAACCQRSR